MTSRIGLRLIALGLGLCLAGAALATPPTRDEVLARQTPAPSGRIVVKLSADSGLTTSEHGLAGPAAAAARLRGALKARHPAADFRKHFSRSPAAIEASRLAAERRVGRPLPDLNRYVRIETGLGRADRPALLALLEILLADPAVETAFLEPNAVPASLGFDAFDGDHAFPAAAEESALELQAIVTPDFTSRQWYLGGPPMGVNAHSAHLLPGGRGQGAQLIDIEGAWFFSHEDIPPPFWFGGAVFSDQDWRDHGTAVLGEIVGADNGYGVMGIAPDTDFGAVGVNGLPTADAIDLAAAHLDPGGIILIELHAPGPNANGLTQFGYMPMEYWSDVFDATLLATSSGLVVVAAAGNGEQNLDSPEYGDIFNRDVRDSGSLMVGAADFSGDFEYFTNYGSRVDLNGWGTQVTTCGFGDLQGGPVSSIPESQWYTDYYSGTSSAAPMVAGPAASLQGMLMASGMPPIDSFLMRSILVQTGTPSNSPGLLGPRPDLMAAWALADGGLGCVAGKVTNTLTGQPIVGVEVRIRGVGSRTLTDYLGDYEFSAFTGPATLDFKSFYHQDDSLTVSITAGAVTTANIALEPYPAFDLSGLVYDSAGVPLEGVRVALLDAAAPVLYTDADGAFAYPGLPAIVPYSVRLDSVPGYGADYVVADPDDAAPDGTLQLIRALPTVSQDFNLSGGQFTPTTVHWSWAQPYRGPMSGFDSSRCWAVGMSADYQNEAAGELVSPAYDYRGESELYLSFHYWGQTEKGHDGVNVRIFRDEEWILVEPVTGYSDSVLSGLDFMPGWSGGSHGWQGAVFDLSAWTDEPLKFAFFFGSDDANSDLGFWVDAVTWRTAYTTTPVAPAGPPTPAAPLLLASPNPFNPATTLSWSATAPGPVLLEIFDFRGRRLAAWRAGDAGVAAGEARWDGRDDAGRPAPSGTYLVRLRDGAGMVASRSLSLIK